MPAGGPMASIQLDEISKVYPDGTTAVSKLSLEIGDGEFMVLVGPSGCGKTTALRMIAGLEDITSGVLRIDGREVNRVASKDRDIAMVFQNYALYPHLTVAENMGFSLSIRGVKKRQIRGRVEDAARLLGIEAYLDRKPRQLSGGQRQRVAMGRAIVREPQAFLMDEPLSNLDAKLRVQMRAEVARIQQKLSTTTVYVTHDQTEAMTMGDRVAVLKKGVLQQVDAPENLYAFPVNLFVGGFIGSPAMNLFEAKVNRRAGSVPERQAGSVPEPGPNGKPAPCPNPNGGSSSAGTACGCPTSWWRRARRSLATKSATWCSVSGPSRWRTPRWCPTPPRAARSMRPST